jgi:hypothetical protein
MRDGFKVAVAVIDTGVSAEHVSPGALLPGINLCGEGLAGDTGDDNGHGTAVATTILRAAPTTRIVPVKLMGKYGYLSAPDHLELAFEWIREHRERLAIRVVCSAFADGSHLTSDEPFRGSRLQLHIAALRVAGVATIAPAGNWFRQSRRWSDQGMAWPAILREVVSVGGVRNDGGHGLRLTDTTQRLHTGDDGACRTTLFAEPEELADTSGATAVVAGRLAALSARYSRASVDQLVDRLLKQCRQARDESGRCWPALARFTAQQRP